jgi:hypothetical protein
MYKAYHINSSTFAETYIGSHVVDGSPFPDYARNDDFSIIFADIFLSVVEELPEAYRSEGELIAIEKDDVIFWYGKIIKSIPDDVKKTYKLDIRHILRDKYSGFDLTDVVGYAGIDSAYRNSESFSAWGQGTLYYFDVLGVLDSFYKKLFPGLITAVTYDFSTASLNEFNTYKFLDRAIYYLESLENVRAFTYLNLFCKTFGITIRIKDNTIIFRRIDECLDLEDYNDQTKKEYPLKSYNQYENSVRQHLEGKDVSIALGDYYQDIIAYFSVPGDSKFKGSFAVQISRIFGYSTPSGFGEVGSIRTVDYHGFLKDYYKNLKVYSSKTDGEDIDEFNNAIDQDYELKRYREAGAFLANDENNLTVWTEDFGSMPRIEISVTFDVTISEAGGKPLVQFPTASADYGFNQACIITIFGGNTTYNGTYYGDPSVSADGHYSFSTFFDTAPDRISLDRSWTGSAGSNKKCTVVYRHLLKTVIPETVGTPDHYKLTFWDAITYWRGTTSILKLVNCVNETESIDISGDYTHGTAIGQWDYISGEIRVHVLGSALMELKETKVYNYMELVKKPEAVDEVRQISFPKHFFFFTTISKSVGGYLGRISGLFPVINSGYTYHLRYANIENSKITDNIINIDDTESIEEVIHKEVVYNVKDRSTGIKQQELE